MSPHDGVGLDGRLISFCSPFGLRAHGGDLRFAARARREQQPLGAVSGYHITRRSADARRDRNLARLGYRVVRIDAALVMHNLPLAVAQVRAALASLP